MDNNLVELLKQTIILKQSSIEPKFTVESATVYGPVSPLVDILCWLAEIVDLVIIE